MIAPLALVTVLAAADATAVRAHFDRHLDRRLVPMLQEVVRFPTVAGNDAAFADQKAWLKKTAESLGLVWRDAGLVSEIELPATVEKAPVLGLIIHGDVQPVEESRWKAPPFSGLVQDGSVWGRGTADDKGPLVQALLALYALREAGPARTHTIRLLVGTNEESASTDLPTYLKDHPAPDFSLVLDGLFPAVVGEKAWNALRVTVASAAADTPEDAPWAVDSLAAGLSPSIVPDRARLVLRWRRGEASWSALRQRLEKARPLPGTQLEITTADRDLVLEMNGRSAHSGMNIEGGRNALVSLANVTDGLLPKGGAADLLRFARQAGVDLYGSGLQLPPPDPLWRGHAVTPAVVADDKGRLALTINIRRPPPGTAADLQRHLEGVVERFNRAHGARLQIDPGFFYGDEPFALDPASPLVGRLLDAYRRGTGRTEVQPAVMGGASYAKRVPRAIAFGMWFPDRPYPGHDVDEHIPVEDLRRGAHVLIEALVDLACGEPMPEPLKRLVQ